MDKLVELVRGTPNTRARKDDDFADRLSSKYSVVILVMFSVFVVANQFLTDPMSCWVPNHFEKSHTKFANNYCWIKNTYYLPWESNVPSQMGTDEGRQMITYYQWIPLILIAQAVLFYLPAFVWHGLNSKAGVDADSILTAANSLSMTDMTESRQTTMTMLTALIDRFLTTQNEKQTFACDLKSVVSATCCRLCGKRLGNYLLLLYLFSKVCYIGNVVGQLFLLNVVLSTKYSTFGFDMVLKMAQNKNWTDDSYVAFPRVTLCDFEIRGQDMSNVHSYTLQCVLPLNLFNEVIYIFLWYWLVFVSIASCMSLLLWILRAIFRRDRIRFIKNHLNLGGKKYTEKDVHDFTDDYLRQDGSLLLRLIAHNSDHITTTEVICSLWEVNVEGKQYNDEEHDDNDSVKKLNM